MRARRAATARPRPSSRAASSQLAAEITRLKSAAQTQVETWKRRTPPAAWRWRPCCAATAEQRARARRGAPTSPVTTARPRRATARASCACASPSCAQVEESPARAAARAHHEPRPPRSMARGLSPTTRARCSPACQGLDGLFGSVKKWAKKTGGALSGGVRKVGGAVSVGHAQDRPRRRPPGQEGRVQGREQPEAARRRRGRRGHRHRRTRRRHRREPPAPRRAPRCSPAPAAGRRRPSCPTRPRCPRAMRRSRRHHRRRFRRFVIGGAAAAAATLLLLVL